MVDNVRVGVHACQSCIANHQSPNTNCEDDIVSLVKMSITNVTKGVVGWMNGYGANGVDGNGSPVKRQLSNRSGDADIGTFDSGIENWTSNNITRHLATAHMRSGATVLSKSSINYENGTTVDDFHFNSDDYGSYRVYHSYQGNGNGIVAFSMPNYAINYGNQTMVKRYPTLDYLCQGYMAVHTVPMLILSPESSMIIMTSNPQLAKCTIWQRKVAGPQSFLSCTPLIATMSVNHGKLQCGYFI